MVGCTSHCRLGLVEMAVTVGTKLALETARSAQKSCGTEEGGGLPSAGRPERSPPPPGPRRPRRRAASAGSTRERPVINISDVRADADAAPESPQ